jgi:dihydroflavonol-4-reductase
MNIVTGASGLVGSNLVRALMRHNLPVRAVIHHDRRGLDDLPVEWIKADVNNPSSLESAFKGADVVYHLAGLITLDMISWKQVEQINVQGTRNVVDACTKRGVKRLVYFSSIHALDQEPLDIPVDENRPLADAPHFPPYDRSKAEAEKVVLTGVREGLDAVIVRPTAIIGPFDFKPSYLGQAIIRMVKGTIPAMVTGGFDWVDARDVAEGAILAAQQGASCESYLLSGHWQSLRSMAETITRVTGKKPSPITVPLWLAYAFAPLMAATAKFGNSEPLYTRVMLRALHSNRQISHAKATEKFGYFPRPFDQTIADTIHWFDENGYLTHKENRR